MVKIKIFLNEADALRESIRNPEILVYTRDTKNTFMGGKKLSVNEGVSPSALALVATSGSYNDLIDKPVIPEVPTDISVFNNDVGYVTASTETDPVYSASPASDITSSNITSWNNKQERLLAVKYIGSMYRSNVSGGGSISINGTKGQFPVVSAAGTYTVNIHMSSVTQTYGLNVVFGNNSYALSTVNGVIDDTRELAVSANARWSASVAGSVASNSIISVSITTTGQSVTEIGLVATTNDYNDLDNKPTIPTVPTTVSSFTNDAGYLTSENVETLSNSDIDTITGYE